MPTYEYRCKSCGYEFEELQQMTSEPLVICPKCAEPSLKRLLSSGGGLLFKGSGFYSTDYKKSGAIPPSAKPGKDQKPGEKSDVKKEPKKETKTDSGASAKTSSDKSSGPENK